MKYTLQGGDLLGEIDRIARVLRVYPQDPRYLLAILLDIQEKEKYLSTSAMKQTAEYLSVPDSRVYAVATFYSTLSMRKKGRKIIRVCMGTACHLRGSGSVLEEISKQLGIKTGETSANGEYTLETVNCVGACALAPVIIAEDRTYGKMSPAKVADVLVKEAVL